MRSVVVAALLSASFLPLASAQEKPAQATSADPVTDRWSAPYVGLNFGYGKSPGDGIDVTKWNTGTVIPGLVGTSFRASRTGAVPSGLHTDPQGIFGGIQAGHNWRVAPEWVLGLEADFDLSNVNGNDTRKRFFQNAPPLIPFPTNAKLSGSQDLNWFGTLRGRAGMLATEDLLLYGTGGLAYGSVHAKTRLTEASCVPPFCALTVAASDSSTRMGWTAGAGLEWALDRDWSFKAEYQYVHLGNIAYRDSLSRFGFVSVINTKMDANFNNNIFRVGVNYRFGN